MEQRVQVEQAAREIWRKRFPAAKTVFLCGSVVRGEATSHSDLDLVVVLERAKHAFRESFIYQGWPVEAFVHDLDTLRYFFYEVDAKSGHPALPQMVVEGIAIPRPSSFSESVKDMARKVLDEGPPPLDSAELDKKRYAVTDLIDDIRAPQSDAELMATGAKLFDVLLDYYFRSNRLWSASGKMAIRRLLEVDTGLATKFESSFKKLFTNSDPSACIALAEEILSAKGGFLFDGYRLDAPESWRRE